MLVHNRQPLPLPTLEETFHTKVELEKFSNTAFNRGAGLSKRVLWLLVSWVLFRLCPLSFSWLKRIVLRLFGARIGKGVVIKPQVKITFPWKLEVGDHSWIGEEAWLLSLDRIVVGSNVCISQRAFLCTGSHNYKSSTFNLITAPIRVENGAWLAAGCWVGPGVTVGSHAVLTAGAVAGKNLEPWAIYSGNPAFLVKARTIIYPSRNG
ncbi:MAG: WcaF family extracellular polysaccharide biosynthesis acetyltransferase [Candidatus Dormibacteraceae bacterium]